MSEVEANLVFFNPGDPFVALVGSANGLPTYVTSTLELPAQLSDQIVNRLSSQYSTAHFVNARGHYKDTNEWQRRWRQEHERYGAAIVLTTPAGDVGVTVLIELADLVERRRPILWVADRGLPTSRFAIDRRRQLTPDHVGRLREELAAAPFRPLLSGDFFLETNRPLDS